MLPAHCVFWVCHTALPPSPTLAICLVLTSFHFPLRTLHHAPLTPSPTLALSHSCLSRFPQSGKAQPNDELLQFT